MWHLACGCGYVGPTYEAEAEDGSSIHFCPACGHQLYPPLTRIPAVYDEVLRELAPKIDAL